jgi:fermentation-respiration switch protein FrsA (DUF1100 family)
LKSDIESLDRSLIFFPEKELWAFPSDGGMEYQDVYLRCQDKVTIHGWFIPGREERVMLFFHGNGGNISHRIEKIRLLCHPHISSLMVDYHGYGLSHGEPSEEACYLDALASWDYLIQERHFHPKQIVLFGESLGGSVAIDLAVKGEVGAVILESTFTNMGVVIERFVPGTENYLKGKFNSLSKISKVRVPLLILHGDEDELVPYELGQELFKEANEPKEFFTIQGAHHNDTYDVGGKAYFQTIQQFIKKYISLPEGEDGHS